MNRLEALLCGCDQVAKQVSSILSAITGRWIRITTSVTAAGYKYDGGEICYEFRLEEKVGDYRDANLLCRWVPRGKMHRYISDLQILDVPPPRELTLFNTRGALSRDEISWLKDRWPTNMRFVGNHIVVEFSMR